MDENSKKINIKTNWLKQNNSKLIQESFNVMGPVDLDESENESRNSEMNDYNRFVPKFTRSLINNCTDKDENESQCSDMVNFNSSKSDYKTSLLNQIKVENNKRKVLEKDLDTDPIITKKAKLNKSMYNSSLFVDQNMSTDFSDTVKHNFSYKSAINTFENQFTGYFQQPVISRIGSDQSLAESVDEGSQGAVASRIYANIFSQKSIKVTNLQPKIIPKNKSFLINQRNRRYKTIIKRDLTSNYLSKEKVDDNELFTSPSKSSLSFNLSIHSEDISKRINLSDFRNTSVNLDHRKIENWTCEECLTQNPLNFNFCPSCSNPNPLNTHPKVLNTSLSNKKSENNWICRRCFNTMKNNEQRCVSCFMVKNSDYVVPTASNTRSDIISKRISTLFESFDQTSNTNPEKFNESSKWECPSCMVENDFDKEFCVCCVTKNPKNKLDNSVKKIPENKIEVQQLNNFSFNPKSNIITNFEIGNQKWQCQTCLLENEYEKLNCVCCNTVNPVKGVQVNAPIKFGTSNEVNQTPSFMLGSNTNKVSDANSEVFTICKPVSANTWQCMTCLVDNKSDSESCICCSSKNSIVKVHNKPEISSKWQCTTCLVDNMAESETCVCCSSRNPSITKHSTSIVFEKKTDICQQIQFGQKSQKELPIQFGQNHVIQFGKKSEEESSIKFGQNSDGALSIQFGQKPVVTQPIQFGKKSEELLPIKFGQKNEGEIKFGQNFEISKSVQLGNDDKDMFQFGQNKKQNPDTNDVQVRSKSPFKCNLNKSSVSNQESKWECPSCMVENNAQKDECVCCQTKKSKPTKATVQIIRQITGKIGDDGRDSCGKEGKWECPTCMVESSSLRDECACCGTKKPCSPIDIGRHSSSSKDSMNSLTNHTYIKHPSAEKDCNLLDDSNKSSMVVKTSNGINQSFKDRNGPTTATKQSPDESRHFEESMQFIFSKPEKVPFGDVVQNLDSDMEFVFSKPGVV